MHPSAAESDSLLTAWGLRDLARGARNLQGLAKHLGPALGRGSPTSSRCPAPVARPRPRPQRPGTVLAHPAARELLPDLLAADARKLGDVVRLFGTSQFLGDVLAADPDFLETATAPLRVTPTPDELVDGSARRHGRRGRCGRAAGLPPLPPPAAPAHRHQRHHPRPARWKRSPRDMSRVADAALEVALGAGLRRRSRHRFGEPTHRRGEPARAAVLAFGKLGGEELNYSSDIDLMFVYDEEGADARPAAASATTSSSPASSPRSIRLLSAHTDRGPGLPRRLPAAARGAPRPAGPVAGQHAGVLRHAGPHLGAAGAHQGAARRRRRRARRASSSRPSSRSSTSVPVVRRDQRDQGAEAEDRARRPHRAGEAREVKTGHGGIRDIEFAIQFLQLLNGGDLPAVRQRNTLGALQALEAGRLPDRRRSTASWTTPTASCARSSTGCNCCSTCRRTGCPRTPTSCASWRCGWATRGSPDCGARRQDGDSLASVRLRGSARRTPRLSPQRHSPLDEPSRPRRSTPATCSSTRSTGFLHDYHDKTGSTAPSSTTCCTRRSPTDRRPGRAGERPDPRPRPGRGDGRPRSSAATRSATCRPPART